MEKIVFIVKWVHLYTLIIFYVARFEDYKMIHMHISLVCACLLSFILVMVPFDSLSKACSLYLHHDSITVSLSLVKPPITKDIFIRHEPYFIHAWFYCSRRP